MADMMITRAMKAIIRSQGGVELSVELWYDTQDPLAVAIDIYDLSGTNSITWTFARSLLVTGLRTAVGSGDIHIEPLVRSYDDRLRERYLLLTMVGIDTYGQESIMKLELPYDDVAAFTDDIVDRVPQRRIQRIVSGQIDDTIARILADAP